MSNSTIDQTLLKDATEMQQMIMRLSWASRRHLANELEQFHLTVAQYFTLRALHRVPEGCTMSALAEASYQVAATMTGIIDRLAEQSLVQRQRSSKDRRTLLVTLTPEGKLLMDQVETRQIERISQIIARLSADERKAFLWIIQEYLEKTLAELPNDKNTSNQVTESAARPDSTK